MLFEGPARGRASGAVARGQPRRLLRGLSLFLFVVALRVAAAPVGVPREGARLGRCCARVAAAPVGEPREGARLRRCCARAAATPFMGTVPFLFVVALRVAAAPVWEPREGARFRRCCARAAATPVTGTVPVSWRLQGLSLFYLL